MTEPTTVSLYEAKTHLSELGERAADGEQIVVTKHGKPRFMIVPVPTSGIRPAPGSIDLRLTADQRRALEQFDWTAPDEDLERDFGLRE
ncbi:hypothetical protein BH10ACT7_BH10ACT7_31680 [soil metagenome]